MAHLAHQHRGVQAFSADVADRDREPAVGQHERIVPIAADLGLRRARQVDLIEHDARYARQALGQDRVLQRAGDAVLALVQARVVERERGAVGELLHERHVRLGVFALDLADDEGQRADQPAARLHRHHQRRGRAPGAVHRAVFGSGRPVDDVVRDCSSRSYSPVRATLGTPPGPSRSKCAWPSMRLEALHRRVLVLHGVGAQHALVVEQIDHHPVGEARQRDAHDVLERPLDLERGVEQRAGLGQERDRVFGRRWRGVSRSAASRSRRSAERSPSSRGVRRGRPNGRSTRVERASCRRRSGRPRRSTSTPSRPTRYPGRPIVKHPHRTRSRARTKSIP